jgi:hypothetical protein
VRFTSLGLAVVVALAAAPARAFDRFTPIEALGAGGAARAWASGDAGPLLNPSGMTLVKAYTVEGAYSYGSRLSDQFLHAAVVDNTSAYGLAGGLYYTYNTSAPAGTAGHGHEVGLSLAFPFGDLVAFGGTLKYLGLTGADAPDGHDGGLTFDLGVTLRPSQLLSVGVVGSNIRDLQNSRAPQTLGYGVAVLPLPALIVEADGLTRFTTDAQTGRKGTSALVGATYTLAAKVALRLGGGYDSVTGNGYGTLGLSVMSPIGALDGGLRQDLFRRDGVSRETVVGVSLRLFVPASQTNPDSAMLNGQ